MSARLRPSKEFPVAEKCKCVTVRGAKRKLCWGNKAIKGHVGLAITSNTSCSGGKKKATKKASKAGAKKSATKKGAGYKFASKTDALRRTSTAAGKKGTLKKGCKRVKTTRGTRYLCKK